MFSVSLLWYKAIRLSAGPDCLMPICAVSDFMFSEDQTFQILPHLAIWRHRCGKLNEVMMVPQRAALFLIETLPWHSEGLSLSICSSSIFRGLPLQRGASSVPLIQIKSRISVGVPLRTKARRPGPWKEITISQIWILSSAATATVSN